MVRPQAAAPTASVASGTYRGTQRIELFTATEGAKIYYTTDGTDPLTSQTKKEYTEKFTVNTDTTVKAYAEWVQHNSPSDVAEFVYKIRRTSGSLSGSSSDTPTYSVTLPADVENGYDYSFFGRSF